MQAMLLFSPVLVLSLAAQDLPVRLQAAQRLGVDDLRGLQAELAASPDRPGKAYFEAYTAYVLVSQLRGQQPAAMEAVLERALKLLEPRKDADSLALTGACLGLKLGFKPMEAMTLAPRASGLFAQALALAPNNPRVLFFQGLHVLHTPVFFGGGSARGLPILEAAAKAAEQETPSQDPWAPAWGRAETLAWLAFAQIEGGRLDAARDTCARALALDPGYGFARFNVLPRLSQGAK